MYNACLIAVFVSRWKIAHLVLVNKRKGFPDCSSSNRSLCMLDTVVNVMEKMMKYLLHLTIRELEDLSERQDGFQQGHSTVYAVSQVIGAVS